MAQKTLVMQVDRRVISFFPPAHIMDKWRKELSPQAVFEACVSFQRGLKKQDKISAMEKLPLPVRDAREVET